MANFAVQLSNSYGQLFSKLDDFVKSFKGLGALINKISKSAEEEIDYLTKLANKYDEMGFYDLADELDERTIKVANDYKHKTLSLLIELADELDLKGETKTASFVDEISSLVKTADYSWLFKGFNEAQPEYKRARDFALSTRYCPDHRGVSVVRLDDNLYQCPLDGKIYDFKNGYQNYDGEMVPGGSVSNQTPQRFDYGGIPSQTYDNRVTLMHGTNY
jgi:tetratricopeptide (TPR) repeat protein